MYTVTLLHSESQTWFPVCKVSGKDVLASSSLPVYLLNGAKCV